MAAKWIGILVVAALAGCGWRQQHLSEYQGRSYDAVFTAQANQRVGGPAKAATGLDSQEASIISGSYRKSLAPKDQTPKEQPILMIAPGQGQPQPLQPSVPKER